MMATLTFHETVLQIQKTANQLNDSVHYHLKLFPSQKPVRDFTFEYKDGNFELKKGEATDGERELFFHCIQVLELSGDVK